MANSELITFAKIDANLDLNPKIRAAGRNGREVFEFVVRRNAALGLEGSVSMSVVRHSYLADVLMMTVADAADGLASAVTAGLLRLDSENQTVTIVGWEKNWGRGTNSGSERQARYIAKQRERKQPVTTVADATVTATVTSDVSCDASDVTDVIGDAEERRGEEKRDQRDASLFPISESDPKPTKRKSKTKQPIGTDLELVSARLVLSKLGERNGVKYSGSPDHLKLIVDRYREDDLTEFDLRAIVAFCAAPESAGGKGWLDSESMRKHLTPETLFGPKTHTRYIDGARSWAASRGLLPSDDKPTSATPVDAKPKTRMLVLNGNDVEVPA